MKKCDKIILSVIAFAVMMIMPLTYAYASNSGLTLTQTESSISAVWNASTNENASYDITLTDKNTGAQLQKAENLTATQYTFSSLQSATSYVVTLTENTVSPDGEKTSESESAEAATLPCGVTIASVEASTSAITVNLNAVSCSGYQIEYSQSPDFSNSISGDYSYGNVTLNGLQPATLYYVRARAYVLSPSALYGNYSEVQSVVTLPEKMSISSTSTPSTTSIKVSFSQVKADKYELQISQKASFSNAKVYSVENDKKSYTASKLKSGKMYYIRIRAVVGSDVYGEWSDVTKQKNISLKKGYNIKHFIEEKRFQLKDDSYCQERQKGSPYKQKRKMVQGNIQRQNRVYV